MGGMGVLRDQSPSHPFLSFFTPALRRAVPAPACCKARPGRSPPLHKMSQHPRPTSPYQTLRRWWEGWARVMCIAVADVPLHHKGTKCQPTGPAYSTCYNTMHRSRPAFFVFTLEGNSSLSEGRTERHDIGRGMRRRWPFAGGFGSIASF